jgi:hypothetical protein
MVYLVGGYILTYERVYAFANHNHFEIPGIEGITLCPNRWLRSQGVPFRLLAVSYKGHPHVILVTRARHRSGETKYNFTPYLERPEDKVVKEKMAEWDGRLADVEFGTVANPYGTP